MKIAESIRKSIAVTLCGLALLLAAPAMATLGPVVSQAYEVALSDFRAPGTANGTVSFKECDECDSRTIRVTGNTRYAINGKSVRFEEFRKAVAAAHNRDKVAVTVLHHLESDTVEFINVSL